MVVRRRSQGVIKLARRSSIDNKTTSGQNSNRLVLDNPSVTSNKRPLTVGDNLINNNMVHEKKET